MEILREIPPVAEAVPGYDGAEPVGSTSAEFAVFIRNELEKWTKVARAAGIEPQ